MNCPRCKSLMIVMERNVQTNSTQTWYQCTTCGGERLLSTDKRRYVAGSGQSLTSRFRADMSDPTPEPNLPWLTNSR